ncbi:alpha/beta fold hydrolase [Novosphingobium sp. 9]|uniref:alpha/beta fold hydrolase n=1 Tax=Novosphingobium sp. 9 TaxID=2025349 RepID=UPI0021B52832|nr:alpha/beta fold hydrolase [Novosphingobium sp. 9]
MLLDEDRPFSHFDNAHDSHGTVYAPSAQTLEPVVFLPGLLCDQSLWRPQISRLADVVAPSVADLTLDNDVSRMAARVLAAAPARFALVGLSMGGYVALEIMRQAPERVTRLALFSTSALPDSEEQSANRRRNIESLKRGRFVGITRPLLDLLVDESHREGAVADALRGMASRVGGDAYIRQQEAIMNRASAADILHSFRIPTLVAVGKNDRVTPPDAARFMRDRIPGADYAEIADCGHLPALERPEETAALLRRWLTK